MQHQRIKEEPNIPIFEFDYLHWSEGGEGEGAIQILVAKCHMTNSSSLRSCPREALTPSTMLWKG